MESQDPKSQDNLEHKEHSKFQNVIMETTDKVTESITNPADSSQYQWHSTKS